MYQVQGKGKNIKSPEKQHKTIHSLNAALSRLIFPQISNAHYYLFCFEINWIPEIRPKLLIILSQYGNRFYQPSKMFLPDAEQKLRTKQTMLNNPRRNLLCAFLHIHI